MQEPTDSDFERWAREHNQGNLNSPTTRQLYENRLLTVEEYISQFRRATIKAVLPTEAKTMTVEDALKVGKIGTVNVRKLLTDNRDKFQK